MAKGLHLLLFFWSIFHTRLVETFHEFSKQLVGFEDAQLRNSEAVKRHFCLSCVAQSAQQLASCSGQKSERFDFADNHEQPIGQRVYGVRQVMEQ